MTRVTSAFALAALAGALAAPDARAVSLNPRGLGQALIYPYYTVNKNQDTLLTVLNTSNIGKAVKLRFHEGYNGRVVNDFIVFLAPNDAWSGSVTVTADGGAKVVSRDRSCTLPAADFAGGVAFSTTNYAGANADGGPGDLTRTREGHVEIVADGDIAADSPTAQRIGFIRDGELQAPQCGALTADNYLDDLVVPTGGLAGSASIVNVAEGTFFGYNADALNGFTSVLLNAGLGDVDYDALSRANSADSSAGGAVAALIGEDGDVRKLDYALGIDAVSAVFMADALQNEFLIDAGIGAATDWVVSLPTKRFYTDPRLSGGNARAPFESAFASPGLAVAVIDADFHSRDLASASTQAPSGCTGFCPPPPLLTLPYEVNALRVLPANSAAAAVSEVLGSALNVVLAPYPGPTAADTMHDAGWIRLDLAGQTSHVLSGGVDTSTQSRTDLHGLPVTGFMVYNIVNSQAAPGRLANYNASFKHRATTQCSFPNSQPESQPCL